MFRIHFVAARACFVLQVLRFRAFWVTVTQKEENLEFSTFEEACNKVREIGLDKLYVDKSSNKFREYMERDIRIVHTDGSVQYVPDIGR